MSWEIIFLITLLIFALTSFILEKIPTDLTAMVIFASILTATMITESNQLPTVTQMINVFANSAPITIAGMFIISAALERCGFIDVIATQLSRITKLKYGAFIFLLIMTVAIASAFINNTAVVVVLLAVTLNLSRKMGTPASKLLIPLSYASIFGGCCTAIGTSTNILVSGILETQNLEPLGMFELLSIGGPLLLIGTIYIALFGEKLLPVRETLTSILSEEERKEYITEAHVKPGSFLIGQSLQKSGLLKTRGVRFMELIRKNAVIQTDIDNIILKEGDRLMLACRPTSIMQARDIDGFHFTGALDAELEQISRDEGIIVEGVIGPKSSLAGKSIKEVNFRNSLQILLMAVHRRGMNLKKKFDKLRFQFGDTLLMMGTENAIENLRKTNDVILLDHPVVPAKNMRQKMPIAISVLLGVILTVFLGHVPMIGAVLVGVVILFLTGCIKPKEGYQSIEWRILMLIFGMLSLGLCMETTGFAKIIASSMVQLTENYFPIDTRPYVMLIFIYICTGILTEALSNNATVVLMTPIAIGFASILGVDPRPFVIATCIASSASFSTPIGYQTNTYVYGVGGYRFSDFWRIGLPLNMLYFTGCMLIIPIVWPF